MGTLKECKLCRNCGKPHSARLLQTHAVFSSARLAPVGVQRGSGGSQPSRLAQQGRGSGGSRRKAPLSAQRLGKGAEMLNVTGCQINSA